MLKHESKYDIIREKWNDERGKTTSLFFGMTLASLGFTINYISNKDFRFTNVAEKLLFYGGSLVLLVTVFELIMLTLYKELSIAYWSQHKQAIESEKPEKEIEKLSKCRLEYYVKTRRGFRRILTWFFLAELLIVAGMFYHIEATT
jgi:hypothetical protein